MKCFAFTLLATLAAATPIAVPEISISGDIEARQLGSSKTELENGQAGACPKAILVFARGSTETGNLVCPFPFAFDHDSATSTNAWVDLPENKRLIINRELLVHLSVMLLSKSTEQPMSGSKVSAAHTVPLSAIMSFPAVPHLLL